VNKQYDSARGTNSRAELGLLVFILAYVFVTAVHLGMVLEETLVNHAKNHQSAADCVRDLVDPDRTPSADTSTVHVPDNITNISRHPT
jgi:hypothetical protein